MSSPGEEEQNPEPIHPGWQRLGDVITPPIPGFEDLLFLPSFDNQSSNIYVMPGDYLTIVDPGNDYTAFMELFPLRAKPEEVRKLVLTHGHFDHAMGALEFLRTYRDRLAGGRIELILHEGGPASVKETAKEYGSIVTEVRGGETLELSGAAWEVIYTPGHTIDGIALYHAPTRTVFSGDVVLPLAVAGPDPKAGGRLDQYLFGLKALLRRDIENLLPGHGPVVGPGGRKVVEQTYEAVMMKILGVENPIPWIQGAIQLAGRGLLEEAVFCCDKEIAKSPDDARTLELKAVCLNDLGRSREALEVLGRLRSLRSADDTFVLVATGYALMGLGEYGESIKCFDAALRIRPDLRDALVYKGMALHLAGKHDEAMEIEPFRTEFVGRFKEELLKNKKPNPNESAEQT
jgi:glyoxylase-like metal-dependent hydrolase (beta-lactamase superfamily II)